MSIFIQMSIVLYSRSIVDVQARTSQDVYEHTLRAFSIRAKDFSTVAGGQSRIKHHAWSLILMILRTFVTIPLKSLMEDGSSMSTFMSARNKTLMTTTANKP